MPPRETEENKEVAKAKSSSKMLIIVAVAVLLAGGGGFFAYAKFFRGDAGAHAKTATPEPVLQEMETFLVNLSDPGGKRYLKLTMKAKLSDKEVQAEFAGRNFEIRDTVIMLLSSKEFPEISKPEDKATLKQELVFALNRLLRKGQVQDVYFTEFLVQ